MFGVQRTSDPAIGVVERLRTRFPAIDMVLVVDPTPHGANRKIANLINMLPFARHDVLVISDSDMHVAPDYLARVADALARPGTGLVTSIYTGLPGRDRLSAQLGAAYINQIFASGALVGRYLGRQDCLGATMALRRDTLAEIGGLAVLSPYVADDGILGRRVRDLGLSVGLAATVPATTVAEIGMVALFRHELRWAAHHPRHGAVFVRTLAAAIPGILGIADGAAGRWRPLVAAVAGRRCRAACHRRPWHGTCARRGAHAALARAAA